MSVKNQNGMANRVDPDEPSHQDLHCLYRYLVWSEGLKGLRRMDSVHFQGARTPVKIFWLPFKKVVDS